MTARPRALLIVNGKAAGLSARRRGAVEEALRTRFLLEPVDTKARGHATEIAARAPDEEVDVVIVLGGDGTVNEVVNGLAGSEVPIAVLPGGGANVYARALGQPRALIRAARGLATNSGSDRAVTRKLPLGRVDGRWFAANCGMGFDAAIVRQVERRPRLKRLLGDWHFVASGTRLFFAGYDRRHPHVELEWMKDGRPERHGGLFLAVVQNVDPFTFLGPRALRMCPDVSLGNGLDWLGIDSMRARYVLPVLFSAFGRATHTNRDHVLYGHAASSLVMRGDGPMPVQADGEYMGTRDEVVVESVPDAISVFS